MKIKPKLTIDDQVFMKLSTLTHNIEDKKTLLNGVIVAIVIRKRKDNPIFPLSYNYKIKWDDSSYTLMLEKTTDFACYYPEHYFRGKELITY